VPFDIAFGLPKSWRRAFTVALGEMEGAQYNWEALAWDCS
jgi:hypothetical protein